MRLIKAYLLDRSATTSIEYAFIGGLIGIAIIVGFTALSDQVAALFASVEIAWEAATTK